MSKENPRKKILKSGKVSWEARYRDPSGRQRSKSFPREKQAKDFLEEQGVAMRRGEWVDPKAGGVRLGELAAAWTAQATNPGTRDARKQLENNLGDLADVPLYKLSTPLMRTWLGHLQNGRPWHPEKTALSQAAIAQKVGQIKAMLKQAVEDGLILKNPATPLKAPSPSTTVTWAEVPTPTQVQQMIATARDGSGKRAGQGKGWLKPHPDLAALIHLTAVTGARASEAAGLSWAHVDVEACTVAILDQAVRRGTGLRPLKTKEAGQRVVTVDEGTITMLQELRKTHPAAERVFLNAKGNPMTGRNFGQGLASVVKHLDLPAGFTPKSLRHFHATELLRAGVPIKVVQYRLGHATARMTMETYAHFMPNDEHSAGSVVGALLSGAGFVRDRDRKMRMVE